MKGARRPPSGQAFCQMKALYPACTGIFDFLHTDGFNEKDDTCQNQVGG